MAVQHVPTCVKVVVFGLVTVYDQTVISWLIFYFFFPPFIFPYSTGSRTVCVWNAPKSVFSVQRAQLL